MYTVGMDADSFVSNLKRILNFLIKNLAENNILNLSPLLTENSFFLYICFVFFCIHIIKNEGVVFSKLDSNIENIFHIIIHELGTILKFVLQMKIFSLVKIIISADYLLVLFRKKNNFNKNK